MLRLQNDQATRRIWRWISSWWASRASNPCAGYDLHALGGFDSHTSPPLPYIAVLTPGDNLLRLPQEGFATSRALLGGNLLRHSTRAFYLLSCGSFAMNSFVGVRIRKRNWGELCFLSLREPWSVLSLLLKLFSLRGAISLILYVIFPKQHYS